jgi:hypothetical protein
MWAAADDERELSFVSACIERLMQYPEAVVCQAHTACYVEGQEERLYVVHTNSLEGKIDLIDRYREKCYNIMNNIFWNTSIITFKNL